MRNNIIFYLFIIILLLFNVDFSYASPKHVENKQSVIASVNGEPITSSEFNKMKEYIYDNKANFDNTGLPSNQEILNRLITGKLIVQEGRNMQLDSLPEIVTQMKNFRTQALMELLQMKQIQNVKPSEKDINKLYRELIKEYKIKTIFIEKEEDAKFLEDEIKKGNNLDDLIIRMVDEGKAKGSKEETWIKDSEINSNIKLIISNMKYGEISSIIKIDNGFTVINLIEVRFTDNIHLKEIAKKDALMQERRRVLTKYIKSLKKRLVKINENLLKSIDYEAKEPGFDNLLKDERIIAEIKGGKPVSVAHLSKSIKNKFFHGIEEAISGKKLNSIKDITLNDIVGRKILVDEALRQKIDKKGQYRYLVESKEQDLLFATFIQKIIDAEIKLKEEDLRAYYESHKFEYTIPEKIKISSITFSTKSDAEHAIESLRKGMEFNWAKSNIKRPEPNNKKDQVADYISREFENDIFTVAELPGQIKTSVAGALAGDYRICTRPDNKYMVLYVHELIPPIPQPFEDIKNKITQIVFSEKRNILMADWSEKLRNASEIKIYLNNDELKRKPMQAQ